MVDPRSVTRLRLVQPGFGRRVWVPAETGSDLELAARGLSLAGPARWLDDLSPDERADLWTLLAGGSDRAGPEGRVRLSGLLLRCPYGDYLPPLDLDVRDDAEDESACTLDAARDLTAELERRGLGVPAWSQTNPRGGRHGDQTCVGYASPHLIDAYGIGVREACRTIGLPLLSDHRPKASRPHVVLDDSLLSRRPDARGLVWRIEGGRKEELGPPKLRDPDNFGLGPPREPDRAALDALCVRAAVAAPSRRSSPRRRAPVEALDEAQALALGGPLAAHLARHDPGPGGRHPARLAWAACLLDRGVPPAAVELALGALGDAADARAAVSTTSARLASGLPTRGAGWLERTLGGDAVTGLALLLTEIQPTAAEATVRGIGGEVKRVERSGSGRGGLAELRRAGSLPREVAAWLRERGDAREAIYGTRDVVSRACQRPGVCARVSQQRRCGSGYHVGAPRRIVCESRLCGPCTARAVELEHDLALVAWRAGPEGPLTRPQDRGTACWAAVGGWESPGEGLAWVRREYGSTWTGSGLATSRELAYDAAAGRVAWTVLVYGRAGAPGASQLAALATAGRRLGRVVDEGDLRPLEECARRVAAARWSIHAALRALAVRAYVERAGPAGADTAVALDEALEHASDKAQGASSRHPCSLRWPTRSARRTEAKARAAARRAAADAAEVAAAAAEGRLPEISEEACACSGTPSYELLDPRDGRVVAHRRGPWTACAAWRVVREVLRGPALEVAAATASDS